MKKYIFIYLILFYSISYSQTKYNPLSKPNTYQNIDNPNYWKNKMPNKDYWQQDVYYNIKAEINERTDIINAQQELTYWNNSPDTLDVVYFHLYQNAFQPDSYCHELHLQNAAKATRWGKYEKQKLGTKIDNILVEGKKVKTELDNTILKVYLPTRLNPNQSITFDIKFKTYFDAGEIRRRMTVFDAWGNKHYNGVHWYPRICVYDAKFGWTKDQHLGKEFYGNFGCYDVELTFASNFIVEATGFLLNRNEVLPQELRKKLDIKNFKDKKWNSQPSVIIPYEEGKKKTWKFHAENVHDFAFTADPTYRIGEVKWKDKICYSLVQEPHASRWQNAAEYGAKCLQVFSEDFGMYVYHKVIVADARSGMEYPMITLDSGSDPGYRDLLAHEIGHMWFFGQVGNNETYRALLDEGFTQFLTAWALIKIDGEFMEEFENNNTSGFKKWYTDKFHEPFRAIDSEIYYSYINDATKYNDPVISTHSDGFNGALRHGGGYRHVYYKTAAMLYNLQYVLGDELFLKAMKYYFNTWKIAHPYNEDFRNAIIRYTKVDLNWFFDQWLETNKRIDYSVNVKDNIVTFKRKSRMQMPIDFRVIAKDGKTYDYHIPNNWFVKKTSAIVLPKWHGWDLIHPEYSTIINIPSGIEEVIIDPTDRLADAYMPDNSSKNNIQYKYNHGLGTYPNWRAYEIKYKPNIRWNSYDGTKLGINIASGYMRHHHLLDATVWLNTGFMQKDSILNQNKYDKYSYNIKYNTNIDQIALNTRLKVNTRFLAGLYSNSLTLEKKDNKKQNKISIKLLSMYRTNKQYLINDNWDKNILNNRIDIDIEHKYKYKYGTGTLNLMLSNSALASEYNYGKVILKSINNNKINRIKIKTRGYLQIGYGNKWAEESKLTLSGANNEEMMSSNLFRAEGVISREDMQYSDNSMNLFHQGGGLNLRGYNGYLSPEFNNNGDVVSLNYNGISGAAINTEVEFTGYLPSFFSKRFETYLFADAGVITNEKLNKNNYKTIFSELRADAGIGLTYTFLNSKIIKENKPITIRFDMPLFLNRPPYYDEDFIQMRYIIGINRCF
tara:strand:- start:459 stop:3644 length:3186 start_codon:yes stop_codon:yes gene_type:complete